MTDFWGMQVSGTMDDSRVYPMVELVSFWCAFDAVGNGGRESVEV